MGNAVSPPKESSEALEIKALEARLGSLGYLQQLQLVFSRLSASTSNMQKRVATRSALEECFRLEIADASPLTSSDLALLTNKVGQALVDIVFEVDKGEVDWARFLKGFERCCMQKLGAVKLKLLFFYYYQLRKRGEVSSSFNFTNDSGGFSADNDIVGHINLSQFQDLLWICWLLMHQANIRLDARGEVSCKLPNVEPLLRAACVASSISEKEVTSMGQAMCAELSVKKLFFWMLNTIVGLSDCLSQYVQAQLCGEASNFQNLSYGPKGSESSSEPPLLIENRAESGLLTPGVAWAIGLSQTDAVGTNLVRNSFLVKQDHAFLLYRSSIHGRGMNRFWACVEGYRGAVLILIAGLSTEEIEGSTVEFSERERWVVGALLREGFENKHTYYGTSGCCLLALDPMFLPLHSSGKGSNYIYSHTKVPGSGYHLQQNLEGIAFGGEYGKERLSLNKDFTLITSRHHAVDKTYQSGQLFPNQGYAPITQNVLEVEVWGLGGRAAEEQQRQFQKRENMFSEQRRKVDLKSFGNWADSPEKMMMDMVSDPNKVQREER